MRNPIDIDHVHSRAIRQEIGERLQQYMRVEPELPASIRKCVYRLGDSRKKSFNRSRLGTVGSETGSNQEPAKRTLAVTLNDCSLPPRSRVSFS
jgi:hypothetical protein